MNPHPEVGQIWRDNDERTKGTGEFTVEEILVTDNGPYALVRREATGRRSRISFKRLGITNKSGYTYIGRKR